MFIVSRIVIQAFYGLMVFYLLLHAAIERNDAGAFVAAALGVLAVVLSQSASIQADSAPDAYSDATLNPDASGVDAVRPVSQSNILRQARVLWWASIVMAGLSAFLLLRG